MDYLISGPNVVGWYRRLFYYSDNIMNHIDSCQQVTRKCSYQSPLKLVITQAYTNILHAHPFQCIQLNVNYSGVVYLEAKYC